MSLKSRDVKKVALLSKLDLTESEVSNFTNQLSSVIDHIDELTDVNTKTTAPNNQTTGLANVTRSDKYDYESLTQDEALSQATRKHNGYFEVELILDK